MSVGIASTSDFATGLFSPDCPSRALLEHLTSKWGVLVIASLASGPARWGELRRGIGGISEKMLAQVLRTLERDGFVHREAHGTVPPRVDYSLTEAGEQAAERLLPLLDWIGEYALRPLAPDASAG